MKLSRKLYTKTIKSNTLALFYNLDNFQRASNISNFSILDNNRKQQKSKNNKNTTRTTHKKDTGAFQMLSSITTIL